MNATETLSRRGFLNKFSPRVEDPGAQPLPLGAKAGLEPYTPSSVKPWNRQRAAHLLRRTHCGAPSEDVDQLIQQDPVVAVNLIIDEAINQPLPTPPAWADGPINKDANNAQKLETEIQWLADMRDLGFRERMTFFWSNHFVTQAKTYNQSIYMYQYLTLLRTHAFGNFKTFTYEIGLLPAMLIFLDGIKNSRSGPNENYARELCELFTMGIFNPDGEPNYTQNDISEIARALTGLRVDDNTLSSYLKEKQHDDGPKTFFGHTGNFGYDDVIDIIFQERAPAIAHHVSKQIYGYFVHAVHDEAIVGEMASIFLANDFEIAPVMRALLASEHFFEEAIIGAGFKSPVDLLNGFVNEAGLTLSEEAIMEFLDDSKRLGMSLFDPPNVAGWPGYHSWLSTGTLPLRWADVMKMINGTDGYKVFDPIPLAQKMSNPDDPYLLSRELADYFLPQPLSEDDYGILADVLLDGMPDYEWYIGVQGAAGRLRGFLSYLVQLPEFQLT